MPQLTNSQASQCANGSPALRLPGGDGALAAELRSYLGRHQQAMAELIRNPSPDQGEAPGRQYARAMDGLLCALFRTAHAAARSHVRGDTISLAAVGSYGRCTLCYSSDLDVRLLAEDQHEAQGIAEALLYPLWDAGITIGHQVVTLDQVLELASTDLPTATSLLDWRFVSGDREPLRVLDDRAFSSLFGIGTVGKFLERLASRAEESRQRYGDSVYLLEPDVRNGAGGVRDFDVLHWIARARWRVARPSELVKVGVLIPREWEPIHRAAGFVLQVRNLLHLFGGRRNDRLTFERQEQVAQALGYGSDGPGVERLMSDYYRHARVLSNARDLLFLRAAPPPTRRPHEIRLPEGLKLINGQVTFSGSLEADPVLALRVYQEAVRRNVPLYPFARSQISRQASSPAFCEHLRASPEAGEIFTRLVTFVPRAPFPHGSVLMELHEVGLLTAMIPEFAPVVGRVHHDVYHVYTVDVHSMKAVERLRALCRGEFAERYAVASRLAAEIARPKVLFYAVLLHDVGKDIGGTNHSGRGAELAAVILERVGLSEAQIHEVQHLIRQHLKMYHTATRRDIEDPKTIEEFCSLVHGHEGLRELFLLTVSDVGTTSAESLTNWKSRMVDELYLAAESHLDQGRRNLGEAALAMRSAVLERWKWPETRQSLERFLDSMPERYVFSNTPERIVEHARLVLEAHGQAALVRAVGVDHPYAEFAFVTDDRPGLLAMIAASIAAAHVEVVAAQIYSFTDENGRTRALDLFWVQAGDRFRTGRTLTARFQADLIKLLDGAVSAADLVAGLRTAGRWSHRTTPSVSTQINLDNRGATRRTIIEVITRDHLGLLFELANALQSAGLVISLAKINTEGNQVADVFYVTEAEGGKVTDPARIETLKASILRAIGDK